MNIFKKLALGTALSGAIAQGCGTAKTVTQQGQKEIAKELIVHKDSLPDGMYKDTLGTIHIDLQDTLGVTPDQNGVYMTNYRPIKREHFDYLKQENIPDSTYRRVWLHEGRGSQEGGVLHVPEEFLQGLEKNILKAKNEGRLPESDWQQKSRLCYCVSVCNLLKAKTGVAISWEHVGYMRYLEQLEKMSETGVIQKVPGLNWAIIDGGDNSIALNMIDKYGVMPKESFHLSVENLDTRPIIAKLDSMLLSVEGKPEAEVKVEVQKCISLFKEKLGTVPETFEYEGKSYTPKQYSHSLGLDTIKSDYISIYSRSDVPYFSLTENYKEYSSGAGSKEQEGFNLSPEIIEELIVYAIDNNEFVGIGSDFYEPFVGKHPTIKYTYIPDTYLSRDAMTDEEKAEERHKRVIGEYNTANHAYVGVEKFEQGGKTFIITADSGSGSNNHQGMSKGYRAMDLSFLSLFNTELLISKQILIKFLSEKDIATKEVEDYKFGE